MTHSISGGDRAEHFRVESSSIGTCSHLSHPLTPATVSPIFPSTGEHLHTSEM